MHSDLTNGVEMLLHTDNRRLLAAKNHLQGCPYRDFPTGMIIPVKTSLLAFWFKIMLDRIFNFLMFRLVSSTCVQAAVWIWKGL